MCGLLSRDDDAGEEFEKIENVFGRDRAVRDGNARESALDKLGKLADVTEPTTSSMPTGDSKTSS